MIITNYCTYTKVGNEMSCANLCVDISRDRFWWGKKLWFPLYFVVEPYNCCTNMLL